jgi:hypothetical protein
MTQKIRMLLQPKNPQVRRPIVQRWIETADERCPLAGMWTALTVDQHETTVEDDLPWRILLTVLRGCATSLPA